MSHIESTCFRGNHLECYDRAKDGVLVITTAITTILLIGSVLAFLSMRGLNLGPINSIPSSFNPSVFYAILFTSGALFLVDVGLLITHMREYLNRRYSLLEIEQMGLNEHVIREQIPQKLSSYSYWIYEFTNKETTAQVVVAKSEKECTIYAFKDAYLRDAFINSELQQYRNTNQLFKADVMRESSLQIGVEEFTPSSLEYNVGRIFVSDKSIYVLYTSSVVYYFASEEARQEKVTELSHLVNAEDVKVSVRDAFPKNISLLEDSYTSYEVVFQGKQFFALAIRSGRETIFPYFVTEEERISKIQSLANSHLDFKKMTSSILNASNELCLRYILEKDQDYWPLEIPYEESTLYIIARREGQEIKYDHVKDKESLDTYPNGKEMRDMKRAMENDLLYPKALGEYLIHQATTKALSTEMIEKAKEMTLEQEFIVFDNIQTQISSYPSIKVVITYSENTHSILALKADADPFLALPEFTDALERIKLCNEFSKLAMKSLQEHSIQLDQKFYIIWELGEKNYVVTNVEKYPSQHLSDQEIHDYITQLQRDELIDVMSSWEDFDLSIAEIDFLKKQLMLADIQLNENQYISEDSIDYFPIPWLAVLEKNSVDDSSSLTPHFFKTKEKRDQYIRDKLSGYLPLKPLETDGAN